MDWVAQKDMLVEFNKMHFLMLENQSGRAVIS